MTVLNATLTVLGMLPLAASLYLLVLTLLWRRPAAAGRAAAREAASRFVILVPAHNEERGIAATVRSLQALDYPEPLRQVVVVADNCTDGTAEVAARHGAQVLVRTDASRRGKGYALQFGIDALLDPEGPAAGWDTLVVVDADTTVSANLLRAIAARVETGAQAVQVTYLAHRTGHRPVGVITEVAFTAFHVVRSAARERLGLSCGLRGNGMAFSRGLLETVPHAAFSRVEDLEFGVALGLRGVRVVYAAEAEVRGDMPERRAAVAGQRERWIGGRSAMARRFVPALVREAVRRRRAMPADLAFDLLVPPLSVLAVASALGLTASAALGLAAGHLTASVAVWAAAAAGLGLHVAHAARIAGRGRALARSAWSLPGYAIDKTRIALRAMRPTEETWVRTLREGEDS